MVIESHTDLFEEKVGLELGFPHISRLVQLDLCLTTDGLEDELVIARGFTALLNEFPEFVMFVSFSWQIIEAEQLQLRK